jgi:hypothetical protein
MTVDATPDRVDQLPAKLRYFVESLSDAERAILDAVIAELAAEEVGGFTEGGIERLLVIVELKAQNASA